jgi:SAM-dependent methyltransferase
MGDASHWEGIYRTKPADGVSWFQPHSRLSLELIRQTGLPPDTCRVIDVGAGASVLVDNLLDAGYRHITLLDIAEPALAISRARQGERAARVDWRVGDVTRVELPEAGFDVWHDRAVFHFLTDAADRRRYVAQVRHAVCPGGYVIVASFGPEGPRQCSNLEVCRYDAEALHGEFGPGFDPLAQQTELHTTPAGNSQEFVYCFCRRTG